MRKLRDRGIELVHPMKHLRSAASLVRSPGSDAAPRKHQIRSRVAVQADLSAITSIEASDALYTAACDTQTNKQTRTQKRVLSLVATHSPRACYGFSSNLGSVLLMAQVHRMHFRHKILTCLSSVRLKGRRFPGFHKHALSSR
jgi:hypothetical protein